MSGIEVDLLIVGGGINGAGIARDAAGRGLRVLLCEQNDLGSATSSASSKLIHGGLRYLEQYEFRLVREALAEREVLLGLAPHIAWPLRFVLPHDRALRPAWMIRAGLFLYDHLAPRSRLQGSRGIDLTRDVAGRPLKPELTKGFVYSDAWVEDSRLVVLNAMDAAERGATVLPRWSFTGAQMHDRRWHASLAARDGRTRQVSARVLVNAGGPWVADVLQKVSREGGERSRLRLVKGSHIVVPRLYEAPHAYILQNADGRIVFVIPYEHRFTLIGTTDVPFVGDPQNVRIDPDEVAYLCAAVNHYFAKEVTPEDVVWSYSGVRPLYDDAAADPSAVTRDYVFDVTGGNGTPPLLSIFGGKITTYRRLAEHAMETLAPFLDRQGAAWTATAPLPGGDMPDRDFDRFLQDFTARHTWLPAQLARRYARLYGTRADRLLGSARAMADLGRDFGGGLHAREVDYLAAHEWAMEAEDILWRRTKLGLHVPPGTQAALEDDLAGRARTQGLAAAQS